jgi:ubiquitin carboxyl-terminal hydrolase 25/28
MKVARKVALASLADDVEPAASTPFQALEALCTYLKNHKGGDQRAIFTENLRYLCSIGEDGGEIMRKAHFTLDEVCWYFRSGIGTFANTEQQNGTKAWRPATPAELKDPNSKVRRDIEDMLEEVMILMDEKRSDRAKRECFCSFLDYSC